MKLTIEIVSNGAMLKLKDSEGVTLKEVYRFDEEDKEGLLEMLYAIDEFCMCGEGKYDRERINIDIVHGNSYECKEKDCKICGGEK